MQPLIQQRICISRIDHDTIERLCQILRIIALKNDILTIAFISQTFYPHVGGTEQQLLTLLPLLQGQDLETKVITRRLPGTAAKEIINGAMVYRCPVLPGKHLGSISFTLFAVYYLFKLKPDCIHAFQLLSPLTIAVVYRTLRHVPVVCKVQRGGVLGDLARIKAKNLSNLRVKLLLNRIDSYQVISKEIYNELQSIGIPTSRLDKIPNGVVLDRYRPVADVATKTELRTQLGLSHTDLIFVAVGRLVAVKNLDLLVKAWKEITAAHLSSAESPASDTGVQAVLLIVGDGPEKATLMDEALGLQQIKFLGRRDDVESILQAADVLIHVSASEGQSNAILEGLSAGLPVLASQVGAAEDQVRAGYNGWLFPPNDLQQLVNAITSAIEHADDLQQMGKNSRILIEENYNIKNTARQLATVYRRLIAKYKATHSIDPL